MSEVRFAVIGDWEEEERDAHLQRNILNGLKACRLPRSWFLVESRWGSERRLYCAGCGGGDRSLGRRLILRGRRGRAFLGRSLGVSRRSLCNLCFRVRIYLLNQGWEEGAYVTVV